MSQQGNSSVNSQSACCLCPTLIYFLLPSRQGGQAEEGERGGPSGSLQVPGGEEQAILRLWETGKWFLYIKKVHTKTPVGKWHVIYIADFCPTIFPQKSKLVSFQCFQNYRKINLQILSRIYNYFLASSLKVSKYKGNKFKSILRESQSTAFFYRKVPMCVVNCRCLQQSAFISFRF